MKNNLLSTPFKLKLSSPRYVNVLNSKNIFNFRFIYNLVSKSKYSDKGDYELLRQSLVAMRDHARENNVKKIGQLKKHFLFFTLCVF